METFNLFCGLYLSWHYALLFVKDPAADATDAPQAWGLLCNPGMKMITVFFFVFPCNGSPMEWNWQGKTKVRGEKPVPVPHCPQQIPHGLTRDRTRASAVRGRPVTAWAMARPLLAFNSSAVMESWVLSQWSRKKLSLYRVAFQNTSRLHFSDLLPSWNVC
jgi:hypothetical protein